MTQVRQILLTALLILPLLSLIFLVGCDKRHRISHGRVYYHGTRPHRSERVVHVGIRSHPRPPARVVVHRGGHPGPHGPIVAHRGSAHPVIVGSRRRGTHHKPPVFHGIRHRRHDDDYEDYLDDLEDDYEDYLDDLEDYYEDREDDDDDDRHRHWRGHRRRR